MFIKGTDPSEMRQNATGAVRNLRYIAIAITNPHLTLTLSAPKGGEGTSPDLAVARWP